MRIDVCTGDAEMMNKFDRQSKAVNVDRLIRDYEDKYFDYLKSIIIESEGKKSFTDF